MKFLSDHKMSISRHAWNCLHCLWKVKFMKGLIVPCKFNLMKNRFSFKKKLKTSMLMRPITVLIWKNVCQVVIWVLRIPQKSFCIQNVHIDTDKNKIWVNHISLFHFARTTFPWMHFVGFHYYDPSVPNVIKGSKKQPKLL